MKGFEQTEQQIQTQIRNYLTMKGWYVMRLNSGRVPVINKYGNKHLMALSPAGTPDLMAFRTSITTFAHLQLLFIEVKRKGNKPTPLQIAKMQELEEYGAQCLVAHSLEEVMAVVG